MFANLVEVEFVLARAHTSLFRWEAQGTYRDVSVPVQRGSDLAIHSTKQVPTDRVSVLADPATSCQRDMLRDMWRYPATGEQLWILDEDQAIDLDMPDHDFWVIDDECVLRLRYSDRYTPLGGEVIVDRPRVARYRSWRDLALSHAVSPQPSVRVS